MTLMTLNPGYGIGISPKQRHKRHQRHYRHARMMPGVWGTPRKCVCGYPNAMLAILLLAKYVSPQIDMFGYIQETFLYGYSYLSYNEKGRTDVAMLELRSFVQTVSRLLIAAFDWCRLKYWSKLQIRHSNNDAS